MKVFDVLSTFSVVYFSYLSGSIVTMAVTSTILVGMLLLLKESSSQLIKTQDELIKLLKSMIDV